MDLISPLTFSGWFQLTTFMMLAWPIAGFTAARRGADLRLFATAPVTFAAAAATLGLVQVIRAMAVTGNAPRATAAGSAETILSALIGVVLATLLAIFIVLLPALKDARRNQGVEATPLLSCTVVAFILYVAVLELVFHGGVDAHVLEHSAWAVFAFDALVLSATIGFSFARRPRSPVKYGAWFGGFIAASIAAMIFLIYLLSAFRQYAMAGTS